MNTRHILFLSIAATNALLAPSAKALQNAPTELKEVVVVGKNAWFEGEMVVFRPTKQAKNLATDATSLVERMHTGILRTDQGTIQTMNGRNVNIFINGVPADEMDLATFWPKNAVRIEYMETSDDPRYMGATCILNFVMKEYTAGGLTKIDADQTFPGKGDYTLSSKLVQGAMTYNAMLRGGYTRDHRMGNGREEVYRDIWYDGMLHDEVRFNLDEDAYSRSDKMYAGFNARYRTDKKLIRHNVAWQWDRNPGSGSHGTTAYTPAVIASDAMRSSINGLSISPSLSGLYTFIASGKLSYGASWNASHSHNRQFSSYSDIGLSPIATFTRENSYTLKAQIYATYHFSKKAVLQAQVSETRGVSEADYTGSTISHQWQSTGTSKLTLQWWCRPSDKIVVSLTPVLTLNNWDINHNYKLHEWMPGVDVSVSYHLNPKHGVNFRTWYHQNTPLASMRTDLTLRQTELKWLQGDALLKGSDMYSFMLYYSGFYTSWFGSSIIADYSISNDEAAIRYRNGGVDHPGVIGEYFNAGRRTNFQAQWDPDLSFLDGKLHITASLTYNLNYYANTEKIGYWRVRPGVSYDFGNFSATMQYASPEKFFAAGGSETLKTYHQYWAALNYGNGNLQAGIDITMPFTRHCTTTTTFRNDAYSWKGRTWGVGSCVRLSVTYTFDYGKKTDPSIEISSQDVRSTFVLGSEK